MTVRTDTPVLDSRAYSAATPVVIATVPTGEVWLLRDITVRHTSLVAVTVNIALVRGAVSAPVFSQSVATGTAGISTGRYLGLVAGDQVQVTLSGAASCTTLMSGARLLV